MQTALIVFICRVVKVGGLLQEEIMSDPDRFVELDEDLPLALLDQKEVCLTLLDLPFLLQHCSVIPART